MTNVRLTPAEQTAIRELAERHFGIGADVRLYGSRADTNARGGDVDLFVETELTGRQAFDAELAFSNALQKQLGEQHIDITVRTRGEPLTAFEQHARSTGIRL